MNNGWRLLFVLLAAISIVSCGDDDNSSGTNTPQPSISGITPAQVALGQRNIEGRIQGQNLSGVLSVNLGASIAVLQTQAVSASEIIVTFTVGRDAQPGARSISVVTSAGTASSAAIFTVQNNQVPTVKFEIDPRTPSKNQDITFDASATTDDGTIASYHWNFGNGKSANGKIVTHKYPNAGTFDVELTATDNQGGSNYASREVEINNNRPPVARFTVSPGAGDTNTEFTFDGSSSEDPDGRIVKYSWDFGDGKKAEGKIVKHTYAEGNYTALLTVTDNDDARAGKERDIEVEKASGGGGGGCKNLLAPQGHCGGFTGQQFCVVSVQGNQMTTSTTLQRCSGLCGEVRRNADGIREFVGDIVRISGTQVVLDYGRLPGTTRPKPGERLRAIWRPCQ
jgi:PKD repeat protein